MLLCGCVRHGCVMIERLGVRHSDVKIVWTQVEHTQRSTSLWSVHELWATRLTVPLCACGPLATALPLGLTFAVLILLGVFHLSVLFVCLVSTLA